MRPTWLLVTALLVGSTVPGCGFRSSLDSEQEQLPASMFVADDPLDFGVVDCRSTPPSRLVRITNEGTTTLGGWSVTIDGPFHVRGPSGGFLSPRATTFVEVVPNEVVTPTAGEEVIGTLALTTNDARRTRTEVPLHLVSRGAILDVPEAETFSLLSPFASTKLLTFSNRGNAPVDVTVQQPTSPEFLLLSASESGKGIDNVMHLAPKNGKDRATVAFQTSASGLRIASLPFATQGPVCGTLPTAIKLIGNGNEGPLSISGDLDYGKVQCGQTAATRELKITNVTTSPITFTVVQTSGYLIAVQPTGATLGPGVTTAIQVTPTPMPMSPSFTPGIYDGAIEIKAGTSSYPFQVRQQPWGASLDVLGDPPSVAASINGGSFISVSVRNAGNEPVRVSSTTPDIHIDPQTIPIGDSTIGMYVSARPDDIGVIQHRKVPLTLISGGPFCAPPNLSFSYRPYTPALGIAVSTKNFCIASTMGLYCEGTNDLQGLGFPLGFHWLSRAGLATPPSDVALSNDGMCWNDYFGWSCAGHLGNATVHIDLPFGGLYTARDQFHACLDNGSAFSCIGTNPSGQWGNGATSSSFSTSLTPAMGGTTGVAWYAASNDAGYAIRGGLIYAAGTKSGGNLGNSTPLDGPVTTPVVVTGISDAVRVSAFADGACAVRAAGAVVCWNTSHPTPTDRGAFTNAVDVVALGYDDLCVRHANAGASCWDGSNVTPLTGLTPPVTKLAYRSGLVLALEGNAAVTRGTPNWVSHSRIVGFDGP